jgi:carbonic anhydrase
MTPWHDTHIGCTCPPAPGRRKFLTLALMGGGAALLSPVLPRFAFASGNVDALLLTCMDFRLLDHIGEYMNGRGLKHKYDHFILAGASLGALTDKQADWGKAFWEHVDVAKTLHHIHKVIVIDHRDCGAYKVFLGQDFGKDPAKETTVHTDYLHTLAAAIKRKHPDLEIELGLMALDGKVEEVKV